jgi:hypothetical protein
MSNGPEANNRQTDIWEMAANYTTKIGTIDAALYAGVGFSHIDADRRTAGHEGLVDWAAGAEFAYAFDEAATVSFGGAYHMSNAYGFDIDNALSDGRTSSAHVSAVLKRGAWSFGGEYSRATAKAVSAEPTVDLDGCAAAIGYAASANLSLTLGWQYLHYGRILGTFYNGASAIRIDAAFLHLRLDVQ